MSIATGFQYDYTDPNTGLNLSTAWIQINLAGYMPNNGFQLSYFIYQNEQDKLDGKNPVFQYVNTISKDTPDFNTYFNLDVLNEIDKNPVSQSIAYLLEVLP